MQDPGEYNPVIVWQIVDDIIAANESTIPTIGQR